MYMPYINQAAALVKQVKMIKILIEILRKQKETAWQRKY